MTQDEIQHALETHIADSKVEVAVDGSHVHLVVVSPSFEGMSAVKKQQLVYKALGTAVTSGAIHAVHMKTYTPDEWDAQA